MKKVSVISPSRECAERVAGELKLCGLEPKIADASPQPDAAGGTAIFCEELSQTDAVARAQQMAAEMECTIILAPNALLPRVDSATCAEPCAIEPPQPADAVHSLEPPPDRDQAPRENMPAPASIPTRLAQLRSALNGATEHLSATAAQLQRYACSAKLLLPAWRTLVAAGGVGIQSVRKRAHEIEEQCAALGRSVAERWPQAWTSCSRAFAAAWVRVQSARASLNASQAARATEFAMPSAAPLAVRAKQPMTRNRRSALLASAACLLALVMGFAIGSRRKRPTPQIPSQAPPAAATLVPTRLVIAPASSAATNRAPAAKPLPASQAKSASPHRAGASSRAADSGDDEVIVRHFRRAAKPSPAVARNGVKHYSDID